MSSNSFGVLFRVTTFGESHGPALGAILDGVPPGLPLSEAMIQDDLDRRRPGTTPLHSQRQEPDRVRLLSGIFEGVTTGAPVGLIIENRDARPEEYDQLKDLYRPGHADLTWEKKFGLRDHRGGGRTSGRETVCRVAAGAVARRLLSQAEIEVVGAVREIAGIQARLEEFPDWEGARDLPLRCPDPDAALRMEEAILQAKQEGDSVGGIVEIRASGVPCGLGEPVFDKLDARLGAALLSIGAVKGVEIGDGFALARLRGSAANDPLRPMEGRQTDRLPPSNRAGGILGGISTGLAIVVRVAVKPTPTISLPQQTIDRQGRPKQIQLSGRHDPCLAPRLVAVAEAMICLVLADAVLLQRARLGSV
ncbi:MAG: chorismate synthase [Bradymonadales bacterium]|nr:chorismate synthase [Bradymonadales bacterium]